MPTPDWPDRMSPPMAWGLADNLPLSVIPLLSADLSREMTRTAYLQRLALRVEWMIQQSENPEQAIRQLVDEMTLAGLWMGESSFPSPWHAVDALLLENPMYPDFLTLQMELPDEPFRVQRMPAAEEAVRSTTLDEWVALMFPGARDY